MLDDAPTAGSCGDGPPAGVPARVGSYRVLGVLGEGGFGVVYEAEQSEPVRRRVALKLIKPGMDSASVVARFEAERQALAVMDHPAIAKVFDGGVTDAAQGSRPYFVMELVRGEPITEFCDRHTLTLDQRVRLFVEVCSAVQHAHAKGVIHRDLKPSNILVAYDGDGRARPKVIDFGVAKALNQRLSEHTIFTERGQLVGTPEYMSPEQAEMSGLDVDTRADVYSLGVVLYELLAGRRPFDLREAAYHEIQRIIREQEPPKPSTRLSTMLTSDADEATRVVRARHADVRTLTGVLRRDLDWVVMKCLEKDRERRYPAASVLGQELERYLAGEPVHAGPPSVSYRAQKFISRHRGAVAAATMIVIVLTLATIVSATFAARESRARHAESIARQRAETEAATVRAVNDFLNDDLLTAVDPDLTGPDTRVADILALAAEAVHDRFQDQPEVRARVEQTLGRAFLSVGKPAEAEPLLRQSLSYFDTQPAPTPARWQSAAALSESLWRREITDEALAIARTIDEQTAHLDDADPVRLDAMEALASALKYADLPDQAEPLYRRVLELRTATHGSEHVDTLKAAYNAALMPIRRGILARDASDRQGGDALIDDGLAELRGVYDRCTQALGHTHSLTLVSGSEIATQLNRLNRYDEAEQVYQQIYPVLTERLGPEHWRVAQFGATYGLLLLRTDRAAQGAALLEPAVSAYEERLGAANPETATVTTWLARALDASGDPADALARLEHRFGALQESSDEPESAARIAREAHAIAERHDGLAVPAWAAHFRGSD